MGICMYSISSSWVINEWIVAATPFGATRHTGDTIDDITVAALKQQGIKWRENGSVYEAVHGKVSDNASNMVKGWKGFDGGFCADHTIELSINNFTGADGIKETFSRAKGIVAYFHRSTAGIQDLAGIQASLQLPVKKPVQDVATRWFSSFSMAEWFRVQQEAVQMYDVKFGSEASKNDAYKDHRMQHADWTIIELSLAVLTPLAHATKHLEGTQYITISLILRGHAVHHHLAHPAVHLSPHRLDRRRTSSAAVEARRSRVAARERHRCARAGGSQGLARGPEAALDHQPALRATRGARGRHASRSTLQGLRLPRPCGVDQHQHEERARARHHPAQRHLGCRLEACPQAYHPPARAAGTCAVASRHF
jgi:hypothetical protein